MSSSSLFRIFDKTFLYKIHYLWGIVSIIRHIRGFNFTDGVHLLKPTIHFFIRILACNNLNNRYPKTPYISCICISSSLHSLRTHKGNSSYLSLSFFCLFSNQLFANSKVSHLDEPFLINKNIVWFDISMHLI